ncbi:MAG: TetR/AcrR family transcriptional regulator [Bacteroidales bacterium]|nr:TetR/AcrR family transcriptional regulator [Bacteroidales bacterium]
MPLTTFHNLDIQRQQEILDVCFKEFALHEYKVASIGNIIKDLGIAKGSFYRYFENKKALYFYLLEYASQLRFNKVENLFTDKVKNFFKLLVDNFAQKVQFDMEFPVHSRFLYNVMQEQNNEEIGNVQLITKRKIMAIIIELLERKNTKKMLRKDIDVFDMAYLVLQVQWGMYDYLELKYNIDFRANVKENKPVFNLPEQDVMRDVFSFVNLLKNGMQKRKT